MATLLYTIFSFTASASLHCSIRREISPCTCSIPNQMVPNTIIVTCEKMESFSHVVDVLQDKFTPDFKIWLKITHSQLLDFDERKFAEMNMNIRNLRLNHNNMRWVLEKSKFLLRVTDRGRHESDTSAIEKIKNKTHWRRSVIQLSPQKRVKDQSSQFTFLLERSFFSFAASFTTISDEIVAEFWRHLSSIYFWSSRNVSSKSSEFN